MDNISLHIEPWTVYRANDWQQDVQAHKIVVVISTIPERSAVYTRLRYGKRFLGRGLVESCVIGGVQLAVGDRLEPTPSLLDVSRFQYTQPPFECVFWRMTPDDRVIHESPILLIEGLSVDTHGIDILHTFHLGPLLRYIPLVLNLVLKSNVLVNVLPYLMADDTRRVGLQRIKIKLETFYKSKRTDPAWSRKKSEIWNLTENLFHNKHNEAKCKAAEAKGLLDFCVWLLGDLMPLFQAKGGHWYQQALLLKACGDNAVQFEAILDAHGRHIPRAAQEQLWASYMRHLVLYMRAGGAPKPKHHLMLHLIKRIWHRGNPRHYGTYRDESLNGVIAQIGRSCHRTAFGLAVHAKFSILQGEVGVEAEALHP